MNSKQPLLTVEQLAARLHRHPETVRQLARDRLIGHVIDGNRILFPEDEVEKYLKERFIEAK